MFDHAYRTIGGESVLLVFAAALIVLWASGNGRNLRRAYVVADANGAVASRHFTLSGAERACADVNRYASGQTYGVYTV